MPPPADHATYALRLEHERLEQERRKLVLRLDKLKTKVSELGQYLWAVDLDIEDINVALQRLRAATETAAELHRLGSEVAGVLEKLPDTLKL